jgi:hypothetical protein
MNIMVIRQIVIVRIAFLAHGDPSPVERDRRARLRNMTQLRAPALGRESAAVSSH